MGRYIRLHSPPGTVCSSSTQLPKQLGPGKGENCPAHLDRALVEHLRTRVAYTLEMHKTQGSLGMVPLQSTLEPEQGGPGKYTSPWAVANPL